METFHLYFATIASWAWHPGNLKNITDREQMRSFIDDAAEWAIYMTEVAELWQQSLGEQSPPSEASPEAQSAAAANEPQTKQT